ncbi:MAG: FtsQ-type POTRA domain-containing protein [Chlorobi bacterium]|nr:FtsQ-type POTRA domain-containing protein [Chlorobiota bacterium]
MKKILKITGYLFLIFSVAGIIYLAATLESQKGYAIKVISITGNSLLKVDEYYKFAKLDNDDEYDKLTLPIIKSRIEKHPYVQSVSVYYDGHDKVTAKIVEKPIVAMLFSDDEEFLISEKMEVLPLLPFTRQIDYPMLSNPKVDEKITARMILNNNIDILKGFKIIFSLKFVNTALFDRLSEIDFRNGGDILLSFSRMNYTVVLGRANEVRKIIYFNTLWNSISEYDLDNVIDYVDLRYQGHIYLGKEPTSGDTKA